MGCTGWVNHLTVRPGFLGIYSIVAHPKRRREDVVMARNIEPRDLTLVIETCPETGFLEGYMPGFPGAHSQGITMTELRADLEEVIDLLRVDGELE